MGPHEPRITRSTFYTVTYTCKSSKPMFKCKERRINVNINLSLGDLLLLLFSGNNVHLLGKREKVAL